MYRCGRDFKERSIGTEQTIYSLVDGLDSADFLLKE